MKQLYYDEIIEFMSERRGRVLARGRAQRWRAESPRVVVAVVGQPRARRLRL